VSSAVDAFRKAEQHYADIWALTRWFWPLSSYDGIFRWKLSTYKSLVVSAGDQQLIQHCGLKITSFLAFKDQLFVESSIKASFEEVFDL